MADYSTMTKEQLQQEFSKLQRDRMGDTENSEIYLKRMAEVRQALDNIDRTQAKTTVDTNTQKASNIKFGTNINAEKPVTIPTDTATPKPAEPEIKPVPTPEELSKPEPTEPVETVNPQFEKEVNKELGQEPSTTINMPTKVITPSNSSGKTYDIPESAIAPEDGGEPPKTGNEAWESVNGKMKVNNLGENRKDDVTANADTIALRDHFQANLGRAPTSEEYERIRTAGSTIQSVAQEAQNPTKGQTGQQNTPTQTEQEVATRQPSDIPPNPFDSMSSKPIDVSKKTATGDIPETPLPDTEQTSTPPLPEDIQDIPSEQPIPPPKFDNQGQPIDGTGMMKLGEDIERTTDASKDAVYAATAKGLGLVNERQAEARESGLSLTDYRQQVESLLDTSKKEGKESLRKMMAGLDRNEKRAFAQNLIYALGAIAAGLTGLQQGVAVGQYYKPEKVFNQGEADTREQNKYSADMEQQKQDLTLQLSKAKDLFDITQKYLDPAAAAEIAQTAKGMETTRQGNNSIQSFINQTMQNDAKFQQELTKAKIAQDWNAYNNLMAHRYKMAEQEAEQKFKTTSGAVGKLAEPERLSDAMVKDLAPLIALSNLPLHRRWQGDAKSNYIETYKPIADALTPTPENQKYSAALNNLDEVMFKKGENGYEPIISYKKAFLNSSDEEGKKRAIVQASQALAASITERIAFLGVSGVDSRTFQKDLVASLVNDEDFKNALSNPNDKKGVELQRVQREFFRETTQDIARFANGNFQSADEVNFAQNVLGFATELPTDEQLNENMLGIAEGVGVTNPSEVRDMYYRGFVPNRDQGQGQYQGQGQSQGQPRQRKQVNLMPSVSSGDAPKNNQQFANIVDSNGAPVQGQYVGILLNQVQPNDKMRHGLQQGQYILPSHMTQDQAFLKNVSEVAKATGGVMDEKALLTLMVVENVSGLPNVINMAGNKSTGATGLFQFLPATVFPYLKEKGVVQGEFDWNRRAEIQNTMANLTRTQQTAIFSDFLQDMIQDAQSVYPSGTKLTPGHIYAIHNQGAQGVRNMLRGQSASNKSGNAGLDLSNINNLINDFNRRIPDTFANESGQTIFGGG